MFFGKAEWFLKTKGSETDRIAGKEIKGQGYIEWVAAFVYLLSLFLMGYFSIYPTPAKSSPPTGHPAAS